VPKNDSGVTTTTLSYSNLIYVFFFSIISSYEPHIKTKKCHCRKKWGAEAPAAPLSPAPPSMCQHTDVTFAKLPEEVRDSWMKRVGE